MSSWFSFLTSTAGLEGSSLGASLDGPAIASPKATFEPRSEVDFSGGPVYPNPKPLDKASKLLRLTSPLLPDKLARGLFMGEPIRSGSKPLDSVDGSYVVLLKSWVLSSVGELPAILGDLPDAAADWSVGVGGSAEC